MHGTTQSENHVTSTDELNQTSKNPELGYTQTEMISNLLNAVQHRSMKRYNDH